MVSGMRGQWVHNNMMCCLALRKRHALHLFVNTARHANVFMH